MFCRWSFPHCFIICTIIQINWDIMHKFSIDWVQLLLYQSHSQTFTFIVNCYIGLSFIKLLCLFQLLFLCGSVVAIVEGIQQLNQSVWNIIYKWTVVYTYIILPLFKHEEKQKNCSKVVIHYVLDYISWKGCFCNK